MSILDILGGILSPVTKLVDELFTSDEEKAQMTNALAQVENSMKSKILEFEAQIAQYKSQVIIAEAQGESWLQRNWRPMLMCVFGVIVANNYILAPYLGAMFGTKIMLEIPVDLWDLLKLGVGGYIGGRSVEKVVKIWKGKDEE